MLDRKRAARLMREAGLDALLLFQPENFTYATGAAPGVASMWRRGGGTVVLVPADEDASLAAVIGDLHAEAVRPAVPGLDIREHRLWIDAVDLRGIDPAGRSAAEIVTEGYQRADPELRPRPTTFDLEAVLALLLDLLRERGLAAGRLGVDLDFLPAADHGALAACLPAASLVDGSPVVRRLRAVKTPAEIDRLRRGAALAEKGLAALAAGIAEGQSRAEVAALWRAGVAAGAAAVPDLSGQWDYVSVGPDPWSLAGTVVPGAIVKADVGCVVAGYSSDTARSYSFGEPAPLARDIHAALADAFEAGLAAIRPGVPLREVYAATAGAMRRAGYPGYQRGHFGHGLGASVGSEEWPFIAADSDAVAEPGMVLAFETPFYGKGVGALTIEDQLLVTDTGIALMNDLPRGLVRLG